LRKLLNSLAAQQGADHVAAAVFVADNDPEQHQAHDLAVALAPAFRWPLTSEVVEEPGISAARNAILDQAREASVNFIAMLDDDEVAEPNWLIELLDCQRRYDADVVGGPVDFDFEAQPSTSIRNCGIFDVPSWKEGLVPLLYASGNLLINARTLHSTGWSRFDRSFGLTGGEDGEFLRRLHKEGARFAWAPAAVARESVSELRVSRDWVLRRSLRKGNINMRIEQLHGGRLGAAISLSKAIVLLGSAPVSFLLLAVPSRRLWILGKWSQSVGKFAALLGHSYGAYGVGPTKGVST
jgi:glycosyltransferase involved in cell wall biosynthesis